MTTYGESYSALKLEQALARTDRVSDYFNIEIDRSWQRCDRCGELNPMQCRKCVRCSLSLLMISLYSRPVSKGVSCHQKN